MWTLYDPLNRPANVNSKMAQSGPSVRSDSGPAIPSTAQKLWFLLETSNTIDSQCVVTRRAA